MGRKAGTSPTRSRNVVRENYNPDHEIITLQSMVLRESLLQFLDASVRNCTNSRPWEPAKVLRALIAIRHAGVDVVTNVQQWRKVSSRRVRFHASSL